MEAVLLETMVVCNADIGNEKGSARIRAEAHRSIAPLILTAKSSLKLPRFRQMIVAPRRHELGRAGRVE